MYNILLCFINKKEVIVLTKMDYNVNNKRVWLFIYSVIMFYMGKSGILMIYKNQG